MDYVPKQIDARLYIDHYNPQKNDYSREGSRKEKLQK